MVALRPRCTTSKKIRDGALRRAITFNQCDLVLILNVLTGLGKKTDRTFQFHVTFQFQTSTQMLATVFWLSPLFRKALTKNII